MKRDGMWPNYLGGVGVADFRGSLVTLSQSEPLRCKVTIRLGIDENIGFHNNRINI